jgi:hypothetical protein
MKTTHFSIQIQASRSHVWQTMLGDVTYRSWTKPFCEGSYFEDSWNTGDRIRFLAPSGSGLTSVIAESRAPEFVSIKGFGRPIGVRAVHAGHVAQGAGAAQVALRRER